MHTMPPFVALLLQLVVVLIAENVCGILTALDICIVEAGKHLPLCTYL